MLPKLGKLLIYVGLLLLAHAAYSAAQHRSYLRLSEQEFTSLPADILIQSIVSLVLTCYGVVRVVGNFREIRALAELENKTWDMLRNRPSFYTYNNNGEEIYSRMPDLLFGGRPAVESE
jgi:hypothetical protein